jgi:Putative adhesin
MRRLLWITIGWAVLASLSLAAQGEEWNKSFSISGQADLRVETSDAQIHVDTWDQKKIEARVTSDKWGFGQGGIEVRDHQTGDSVELEARFPHGVHIMSIGNRRTIVEIHMPREGRVRLHTGDGEIRLRDLKGEIDVESGDGRLEVEGVDGVLRAHSGDGHVRARGRFDHLDISTSDGRIEAEALAGSTIGQGWNLKTGDGGVLLTVPENFVADLVLHTGDGHITLDMPVTVEGKYESNNVRGKLNGGGGLLTIHTGDGSIRLGKS